MNILSFIILVLWLLSMATSFVSMMAYILFKAEWDNDSSSKSALCGLISGIATIITTIFKCLFTALSIKTTIIICIIAIVFSILFFILYKRDKVECEIKNVIVRIKSEAFFDRERKEGILKINRNRKILYESHIKTLYKMCYISNKFGTEEVKETFIKEFVDEEVSALKNDLKKLSDEMGYEIKAKDEEILKAYRKLKS